MICAACPALKTTYHVPHRYTCGLSGDVILDVNHPPESCQIPEIWLEPEELMEVVPDGQT